MLLSGAGPNTEKEGIWKMRKQFAVAAGFLVAFVLWTAAVLCVDVQPIGPMGSSVGLGAVNGFFRDCIGVNFALYEVTDWLGLVPIGICVGFGVLGLSQWTRRGRISAVDRSVLLMGGFYLAVMAVYIFFGSVRCSIHGLRSRSPESLATRAFTGFLRITKPG